MVQHCLLCRERWLQLDPAKKDELRAIASLEYKTWYNNKKILHTTQVAKGQDLVTVKNARDLYNAIFQKLYFYPVSPVQKNQIYR
jgi:transcriptional regulator NrdR family protein